MRPSGNVFFIHVCYISAEQCAAAAVVINDGSANWKFLLRRRPVSVM